MKTTKSLVAIGYKNKSSYVIWGIGSSKTAAWKDAKWWIRYWCLYMSTSNKDEIARCRVFSACLELDEYLLTHGGHRVPAKFILHSRKR